MINATSCMCHPKLTLKTLLISGIRHENFDYPKSLIHYYYQVNLTSFLFVSQTKEIIQGPEKPKSI